MNQCLTERFKICSRQSPFYVLRPKTVRFPNQKHTASVPRTYGFGTENIKGCRLNRSYNPSVAQYPGSFGFKPLFRYGEVDRLVVARHAVFGVYVVHPNGKATGKDAVFVDQDIAYFLGTVSCQVLSGIAGIAYDGNLGVFVTHHVAGYAEEVDLLQLVVELVFIRSSLNSFSFG